MFVVVWLFVAFVLTSSYTANLASTLTAQQITPHINDNLKVGYRSSYVGTILNHDPGKAEVSRKQYSSKEEYEEALSKGAKNGGVDVILDEIPFVCAFVSGRCGYSKVFPKGSMLVQDFSQGILHLSASDEIRKIGANYFNDTVNQCFNSARDLKRLDVISFLGLYLIMGTVSTLSVIVFFFGALRNFTNDLNSAQLKTVGMWKSFIKAFALYLHQEEVSSQHYEPEIRSADSTKTSNMKESSNEHL